MRTAVNLKVKGLAEGCNEASLDKTDHDHLGRPGSRGAPPSASNTTTPPSAATIGQAPSNPAVSSPDPPQAHESSPSPHPQQSVAVSTSAHNNNSSSGEEILPDYDIESTTAKLSSRPALQHINSDGMTPPPPKRKRGTIVLLRGSQMGGGARPIFGTMNSNAFLTNAQSRFSSVVLDGVLGPPHT